MSVGSAGQTDSAGQAPAVSIRKLRKRFGYRDVLRGIDLDVPRGGCFALVGPNGAGKSTLLKIVATLWTFQEGTVNVFGLDARKAAMAVKARIGCVFHDSFLRREFTLQENLRFHCDLHGLPYARVVPRAEELLDRYGLRHRRHDVVGTFSQGMVRRAAIIRSLLTNPSLWILDEPFSGLDVDGRGILVAEFQEYVRGGGTVLLVTHRDEMASRLAGASARLDDGMLVAAQPGGPAPAGKEAP